MSDATEWCGPLHSSFPDFTYEPFCSISRETVIACEYIVSGMHVNCQSQWISVFLALGRSTIIYLVHSYISLFNLFVSIQSGSTHFLVTNPRENPNWYKSSHSNLETSCQLYKRNK